MGTGLLLVDIQNDYFPGGRMELARMEEVAAEAKKLLDFFRKKNWPTYHVRHLSIKDDASFFIPGTKGADIHNSVAPLSDEVVIRKNFPNSFLKTNLADELAKSDTNLLVICGAMSHMCIDATTRAAADMGYDCIVIHDACATRNIEFEGKTIHSEDVHGAFMAALGAAYAKLMSVGEYVAEHG